MTRGLRPRNWPQLRREAGVALAEVLIAIVVIGLGMTVVVGSYATGVRTTGRHGDLTYANITANVVAEWVAGQDYSSAGSYTEPPASAYPPDWGPDNVDLEVECWDDGSDPPTFNAGCGTDTGLQLVRIELSSALGSRTLEILKRDPTP